jgi:rRNA biogenesis protein RRP5
MWDITLLTLSQRAADLFQRMTKIKDLTSQSAFWLNYGTFLMTTTNKPNDARALLMRATQSVEESQHRTLTSKFGALEFQSPNGDPERGRTVFEGLLSAWPRRGDLWDMFVDLEKSHGSEQNARNLYERMSKSKMKKRRARYVFKSWLDFEQVAGQSKDLERVQGLAAEYVKRLEREGQTED